jgi:hypothetical protein
VRDSSIDVLILNGSAVVQQFEPAASVQLDTTTMIDWTLRRQAGPGYPICLAKLAGGS